MTTNPHFETVTSWNAERTLVAFQPLEPHHTAGLILVSIQIHVRDHKRRELPLEDRTLEAHSGAFVVSQSQKGAGEARRLALDVSYGPAAREARIAGHNARVYELGPEPTPDDIDGRRPAVVTWHDGDMFYLIASGSGEMSSADLVRVAVSMYRPRKLARSG